MSKMRLLVPGVLLGVPLGGCAPTKVKQTRPDQAVVATVTLEVPGMT